MESPFDPQENPSDSLFEGCALEPNRFELAGCELRPTAGALAPGWGSGLEIFGDILDGKRPAG
jgi:hypothetical protein